MATTTDLKTLVKKAVPMPLEWQIAAGMNVTEESLAAARQAERYTNRDRIPERLLPLADLYNELTGQEPYNSVLSDWIDTIGGWKDEGFEEAHIRAAWNQAMSDNGFPVGRPGSLTVTIRAMKTKAVAAPSMQINEKAIQATAQAADQKWDAVFVPRPANVERPKNLPPRKASRNVYP